MKPHERAKGGAERDALYKDVSSEELERQMGGKIKEAETTLPNIKYSHRTCTHLLCVYHVQGCSV